jgi:hypothetical protein
MMEVIYFVTSGLIFPVNVLTFSNPNFEAQIIAEVSNKKKTKGK